MSLYNKKMPPRIEDVKIYFSQKGMPDPEAEAFFLFYEKKQWTSRNGTFFTNWKGIAYYWIASVTLNNPFLLKNLE